MTQESSRMSLLGIAGKKGSASTGDITNSEVSAGAPVDTKEPQMVFSTGVRILGIQENPDDPGAPQGVPGKGSLLSHNDSLSTPSLA